MSDKQTTPKPPIDWVSIEMDYRAGVKTLRQMADEHGITHGSINKRAKRDDWSRDLVAKIKAKLEDKVSRAAVSNEASTARLVTETQVIEANADLQYRIIMAHRTDIGRARSLFRSLLGEIEAETDGLELFKSLGELLDTSGPDHTGSWRKDKLNEIYTKVIGSGGRIDSAKKLTEMLEKLVKMERQVFGIEDGEAEKAAADTLLKSLGAKIRAQADA